MKTDAVPVGLMQVIGAMHRAAATDRGFVNLAAGPSKPQNAITGLRDVSFQQLGIPR